MAAPLALLVLLARVALPSSAETALLPTDVSGVARGVAAVALDPAAAARSDGLEVQLRQRGGPRPDGSPGGIGGLGVAVAAPLFGSLGVGAGYGWDALPAPRASVASLVAGWAVRPGVGLGVAARLLQPLPSGAALGIVDVGALIEPTSFIALSIGIDALNAPDDGHLRVPRALRLGLAARPLAGLPHLTLAVDGRAGGGLQQGWEMFDSRALLTVAPVAGVQAFAALRRARAGLEAWVGVSLESWGAQVMGSTRAEAAGVGITAAAVTVRAAPAESALPPPARTVEVRLEGSLAAAPRSPLGGGALVPLAALQLDALAAAPQVTEVVLAIRDLRVALATVDELRAAIYRLRDAGKCVVAELQGGDDAALMVAAAAERIVLDPLGSLQIDGFAIASHYLADTLAKLGIRFDAVGIGRYKTAPDLLTARAPRAEDREVHAALLAEAQAGLVAALRYGRGLDAAAVASVLAHGSFTAREALEAGLVDALGPGADAHAVPPRRPVRAPPDALAAPRRAWGPPPTVAIVPISGAIVVHPHDSPLPGGVTTAAQAVRCLERALDDPEVIGAVLRVDSPGGDALASELIWRAVRRLAAVKPVVASLGDTAASGGYYVAAPAQTILAAPNTITGSIGVFTVRPDVSGLLGRLEVHSATSCSSPRADWQSVTHPLRAADRPRVAAALQPIYDAFVERVAIGRQLAPERARELADGRVYTGRQAQVLGLVDQLGGLPDAVREVRRLAGLADGAEVALRIPERSLDLAALAEQLAAPSDGGVAAAAQRLLAPLGGWDGRPLALMPQGLAVTAAGAPAP